MSKQKIKNDNIVEEEDIDEDIDEKYDKIFYGIIKEKNKILPMRYDKKAYQKEYVNQNRFRTQAGRNINYALVLVAEASINRNSARKELLKYLEEPHLAYEMEKGLYEFSLIQVSVLETQNHFVSNIYSHQLATICRNLDPKDDINNTTLFPMIWRDGFDPYIVPFLAPDQMCPGAWIDVVKKRELQEDTQNNFLTTDMYVCKKCKARKFKMLEMQIRSIDESSTKFFTCTVCYFTFTI
jgi:DNA-directed RNA polymerase subunit M/transcription elongation factor TFIIS